MITAAEARRLTDEANFPKLGQSIEQVREELKTKIPGRAKAGKASAHFQLVFSEEWMRAHASGAVRMPPLVDAFVKELNAAGFDVTIVPGQRDPNPHGGVSVMFEVAW